MNDKFVITEGPEGLELNRRAEWFEHNGRWLIEHGAPLFEQHPGKEIAVSEGEVFVSVDAWEARQLAKEKHAETRCPFSTRRERTTSALCVFDGRDVTNNFDVIYPHLHQQGGLRAPSHRYQIMQAYQSDGLLRKIAREPREMTRKNFHRLWAEPRPHE